ncbi:hypothetical protein H5410_025453 [Solanum commersonii]|uniref:DUF295 domain-containing protein n=1 Tax=Solanum commersonii TaxID=4109 RepID=A0A9J5YTT6_SOLCO|nr:hypothetical protein H5410_025453 [Solanum commersonii]
MALRSVWQEELLIEIMVMIVKNVNIGDYVRMAAVCKSWRSMLAHQHVTPVNVEEIDVKLPPLNTIPYFPYFEKHRIAYMINMVHVFSISDDSTRDLIVVANFVIGRDVYSDDNVLGFCNCEEEKEERSWVILDVDIPINRYESMLFHNDVLYTLVSNHNDDVDTFMGDVVFDKRIGDEINHVVVLKTDCCEVKMKIINIMKYNTALHIRPFDNELEHDGDYDPNVHQIYERDDDYYLSIYYTSKLVIERYEGTYKANTDFESITSLDDQALFVSPNSNSFSIPARSDNGCLANSIYFTADVLDVFYRKSLEETIKRPFPNPPLWFQPRLCN